ncbi:hypothetical protein NPIL_615641 [Nephila pilipes]|uniref:Uncharacterized protein n=1 Tax=Nephila pilipes TaxID=299642 RepID=A0A8X6NIR3_NEPPI|nr:hypothetical protein NPIL_615641 [Nephila pilipes]
MINKQKKTPVSVWEVEPVSQNCGQSFGKEENMTAHNEPSTETVKALSFLLFFLFLFLSESEREKTLRLNGKHLAFWFFFIVCFLSCRFVLLNAARVSRSCHFLDTTDLISCST